MTADLRPLALVARGLLRLITAAMFAAGAGALVAAAASWAGATRFPSLAPLFSTMLMAGTALLAAVVLSAALMPPTGALTDKNNPAPASPPALFVVYLTGLVVIAALSATPLVAWWAENSDQVNRFKAWEPDPSIAVIPMVVLFAMPIIASAAMVSFALTTAIVAGTRRSLVPRALAACAAIQAGLVGGLYLLVGALRRAGDLTIAWIHAESRGEEKEAIVAQVSAWFDRQGELGGIVVNGLLWIVVGYLLALAASLLFSAENAPVGGTEGAGS